MKSFLTILLIAITGWAFSQPTLSAKKVPYKISKVGAKDGFLYFSELSQKQDFIHTFYTYEYRKKKSQPLQKLMDVVSYEANTGKVSFETVPSGTDIMDKYDLTPLTEEEVEALNKLGAKANEPPEEVVEFSGIKLYAREGRLTEDNYGKLTYDKTGEKVRLQQGYEDFISPTFVHPIDQDFSYFYSKIDMSTGFFSRILNYAIVAKGARAFILGTIQGRLFAGVYNTESMAYDQSGLVQLNYSFFEVISYDIDALKKQAQILYTTSREEPRIISMTLDLNTTEVLSEKALTQPLKGMSGLTKNNLIESGDDRFIASFADVPKDNPNWGRNKLASFDVVKISAQNSWEKKYTLDDLVGKLVSAPGEKKKAKFNTKGTQGFINQVVYSGDQVMVQGHFILGGAQVSIGRKEVGSQGKRKTFIAQINSSTGALNAFYQFDDIEFPKSATGTVKEYTNSPASLQILGDNSAVLTIKKITQGAGEYKYQKGNLEITYRIINDYGWVKMHKINLDQQVVGKGLVLGDKKTKVLLEEDPMMLGDDSFAFVSQSLVEPGLKKKFSMHIVD
ncbi:MAG: hypothetical protein AAF616_01885 [Bacteroidota bacterium]